MDVSWDQGQQPRTISEKKMVGLLCVFQASLSLKAGRCWAIRRRGQAMLIAQWKMRAPALLNAVGAIGLCRQASAALRMTTLEAPTPGTRVVHVSSDQGQWRRTISEQKMVGLACVCLVSL